MMRRLRGGSTPRLSPAMLKNDTQTANLQTTGNLLLLLILFAGSGCSALIYEIVWYQLLQFSIGSTAVSLGILLATFMGGLCIGSIALPRFLGLRRHHPLRVYAALEVAIAVCGVAVLFEVPLVSRVYLGVAGHGLGAILLRAMVCLICLLPPTALMGASLPAVARWLESTPRGISWLGLLYGGNTAGAVCGCLLAGFYLLRVFDMRTATFVAAAINAAVAVISFGLAALAPARETARDLCLTGLRLSHDRGVCIWRSHCRERAPWEPKLFGRACWD